MLRVSDSCISRKVRSVTSSLVSTIIWGELVEFERTYWVACMSGTIGVVILFSPSPVFAPVNWERWMTGSFEVSIVLLADEAHNAKSSFLSSSITRCGCAIQPRLACSNLSIRWPENRFALTFSGDGAGFREILGGWVPPYELARGVGCCDRKKGSKFRFSSFLTFFALSEKDRWCCNWCLSSWFFCTKRARLSSSSGSHTPFNLHFFARSVVELCLRRGVGGCSCSWW